MRSLAKYALAAAVLLLSGPVLASSALEPTHISLPSGPGSIEGLGRSFAPSLASGTASYGVDIAVPPSAGGFEPHLSLDYDSGGGVTDVGTGWKLSGIPTIRRRTENGLPLFTATDAMEIAGEGIPCDLLQVSPGTFRPQWESGAFVRIQQSGADTWQVRDKAGVTWNFGGAGFEEVEGTHVATYLPSQAVDLHGHVIKYQWDASSGYALLQSVVWNDFGDRARNEILISYEARPDTHVLFQNGIKQTLTQRMTALEVRHGGQLVRRYELTYGTDLHSRLATVSMVGRDGTSRLPTLSLGYTTQTLRPTTVAMQNAPGRTPGDPNVEISDLDGDGLPDLLVTLAGQYSSFQNQDGQSWQSETDWDPAQSPSLSLGQVGVQLADLDGDGAIDLVAKSGTNDFRYFPGSTLTTFRAPVQIASNPSFTFEDPDTKLADMDGDRLIDVLITTVDGLAIGYNRGGVDWTVPAIVGQVDPAQALRFSDGGHTQLCDVNGDRVEDFCYLTPGSLAYWLGRGRGVFEPAVVAAGVPAFDPSSPWELHDLNGDGWVDLVHVDPDQIEVALAHAAGQFDAPQTFTDVPTKGPNTTIRYADMNGSGTTDIVWIDVTGAALQAWQYVELFPAGRAGLLSRVDNGLGKVTTMTYRGAALDAAAARTAGTPWTSRMNVPMSVVHSVQVDDSLGDPVMETDYDYADGTWSPAERTFAGFAGGTDRELGDAYTPTLVTTSTFDVGLVDRTLRGSVLTTQTGDTTGTIFSATTTTWATRALQTGMDGRTVNYSFKTSEQTQHIEGTDASQARVTLVEWDQDGWGNTVKESNWGEVVGGNKLAGNDEAITLRTFANDTDDWILGRLASEELQDGAGSRVRSKQQFYDGAAFQGLPLGQVTRGDVAREIEWVGPDASAYQLDIATAYDADGNPIETRDARGGGHLLAWDPTDHTTLLSESVKLGTETLTESVVTDPAFGTILSITPYDGQMSTFTFDAFGRVLTIAKPGDTDEQPTLRFGYNAAAPLSNVTAQRRIWIGRSDVEALTSYFDGLGRKRVVLEAVEGGKAIASGVGLYDARGEVRRSLRPWYTTGASASSPPLTGTGPGDDAWRDALGRGIATRSQLGIATRTAYLPLVKQHWDGAQTDPGSPYEHTPHTESYDGLERLVATTDVLSGKALQATFTYDAAGELLSRTDPEGNTASYAYDGRGRRTDVRDPDAGHHAFQYDATGNLLSHRHPDGAENQFTYDLAGRVLSEDWDGDGSPEVVRAWDHALQGADSSLYRGRLAQVTDPSGGTRYEYDARGNQSVVHHDIQGANYDVDVAYDDQDRLYWRKFPDGSSISINRDARGAIVGYGDAAVMSRDADGAELQRSFNTGVVELFGYDADRRPSETLARDASGNEITHLKWTLDGANNILAVSDLRAGVGPDRNRRETYGLDNLYRLKAASGTWGSSAWGYSPSGNVLTRAPQGASVSASYGQGAGPHALTTLGGRTMRYDAGGRMVSDGDRQYTWNAIDQLVDVRATSGGDVQSTFDADGMRRVRVEVSPGGQTTQTLFIDPWCEVQNGQLVRYLVHEGRRFARLAAGTGVPVAGRQGCSSSGSTDVGLGATLIVLVGLLLLKVRRSGGARVGGAIALSLSAVVFLGCGQGTQGAPAILQGTIQQLSAADELLFDDAIGSATEQVDGAGNAKSTFAAFPYGVTRYDTSAETRKYANSPRDASVGLDQMGARAYAPDLGAWTSTDPLAVESPEAFAGKSFASGNPYAYAGLNPVSRTDADGHMDGADVMRWAPVAAPILGPVVGAVAEYALPIAVVAVVAYGGWKVYDHYWGSNAAEETRTLTPTPALQPVSLAPPPSVANETHTAPPPSVSTETAPTVHTTPAHVAPKSVTLHVGTYDRPSGHRSGVRGKVWNSNVEPATGRVRDPVSGRFMSKDKPWDMGHKPGYEFREHQKSARQRGLNRKQFLDEHNKAEHYRPEEPGSNRSHQGEDNSGKYKGP